MPRSDYIPEVKPTELKEILEFLDKLDNPPALMIFGVPGIGKTTIVKKFAEEKGYELRIKHLSRMDPTDWTGIPKNDPNDPYTSFRPISLFRPSEKRIVIFFDELNTALPQVLNSALDVILEKRGDIETYGREAVLPENTIIVAAGNLGPEEDGTYVEELSSAVKTRLIQVVLKQAIEDWVKWAKENNVHKCVIDFLENHPEYLVDIQGFKDNLQQIATPRGWERVSNYIKKYFEIGDENNKKIIENLIIGTVGKRVGEEFIEFMDRYFIPPEELLEKLKEYINLFDNPRVKEIGNVQEYLKYTKDIFELIVEIISRGLTNNNEINEITQNLLITIYKNFFNIHTISRESLRMLAIKDLKILKDYVINNLKLRDYEDMFNEISGTT